MAETHLVPFHFSCIRYNFAHLFQLILLCWQQQLAYKSHWLRKYFLKQTQEEVLMLMDFPVLFFFHFRSTPKSKSELNSMFAYQTSLWWIRFVACRMIEVANESLTWIHFPTHFGSIKSHQTFMIITLLTTNIFPSFLIVLGDHLWWTWHRRHWCIPWWFRSPTRAHQCLLQRGIRWKVRSTRCLGRFGTRNDGLCPFRSIRPNLPSR